VILVWPCSKLLFGTLQSVNKPTYIFIGRKVLTLSVVEIKEFVDYDWFMVVLFWLHFSVNEQNDVDDQSLTLYHGAIVQIHYFLESADNIKIFFKGISWPSLDL
jgi:hypothetical protein